MYTRMMKASRQSAKA